MFSFRIPTLFKSRKRSTMGPKRSQGKRTRLSTKKITKGAAVPKPTRRQQQQPPGDQIDYSSNVEESEPDTSVYEPAIRPTIPPASRETRAKSRSPTKRTRASQSVKNQKGIESQPKQVQLTNRASTSAQQDSAEQDAIQVPSTIDPPTIEPERQSTPSQVQTQSSLEIQSQGAPTPATTKSPYIRKRYCNMCDELRVYTDDVPIPHLICDLVPEIRDKPSSVSFDGYEISITDSCSFESFKVAFPVKDDMKNFLLSFFVQSVVENHYSAKFFGNYVLLWRNSLGIVLYETADKGLFDAIPINQLDLESGYIEPPLELLQVFRRSQGVDHLTTIGLPSSWLHVFQSQRDKTAHAPPGDASHVLGLFNAALVPEWRLIFSAFESNKQETSWTSKAIAVALKMVQLQSNSSFRDLVDVYVAYTSIYTGILWPRVRSYKALRHVARSGCRH
ncbi:Piso0_002715 [Millerozyma farinosa CBS 7064]|uniref:Piso0_002715 protein n=1 Tax=Pichia sorbitophila (strain ATCC MYA-4447 / BCRC 22081 / CBS 7064 / NBRC 10061 / NRRL Y-12695) TaxID=559304 RepID=G8YFS3_PICSO|nr:Piso0_002715 [Millerozyma farinosa CBS 7064]